ncbi:flavodoxin domain-containing protein [Marispirochaeta sp.]|uniref:flavodoxin family protein n=1 Tax=Marispirochaeta sp. TaxID=2038653 RepID=UPI0029C96F6C|nr:flavodoxin domain-containing protein [Marispirochaeta sp.]
MNVLIVYDSFFGNTEKLAMAMAKAIKEDPKISAVSALRVEDAQKENPEKLDLLIVGSPTRAFRPSQAITGYLKRIPPAGLAGIKAAAFDTGISQEDASPRFLKLFIRLFGYAAKPIATGIRKKGAELVMPPEGFLVKDSEGPLKEGELQRAAAWAEECIKAG